MRPRKWLLILGISMICSTFVWPCRSVCKEAKDDDDDRPAQVRPEQPAGQGPKVLAIDDDDQERAGIVVAPPIPSRQSGLIETYGTVLPIQDLLEIRQAYTTATGKLEEIQADLDVSTKEYDRLKGLNKTDRNVSDKALQTAEAKRRSLMAGLQTAKEDVRIVRAKLTQSWGKSIGDWILTNSPVLDRLIRQDELLIEITVPSNSPLPSPPRKISVQTPNGNAAPAKLISPSPRLNTRTQGFSFFYLAASQGSGLIPGMNIAASLPSGPESEGVIIPGSAVIWLEGKAWVYIRTDSEHFVRREVPTDAPLGDGWFVKNGFGAGELITVKGAQMLLSSEFLTKTKPDED